MASRRVMSDSVQFFPNLIILSQVPPQLHPAREGERLNSYFSNLQLKYFLCRRPPLKAGDKRKRDESSPASPASPAVSKSNKKAKLSEDEEAPGTPEQVN